MGKKFIEMIKKISPENLAWTEGKVKNFFGKDLIALDNGSLKMVKIAPRSHYPLHYHPDKTEYAFVLQGLPEFEIGGECLSGKPEDFFIFPKNEHHAILNNTDASCLLLIGAIKV